MTRRKSSKQSSSTGRVWRTLAMALIAGFLASNFAGCRTLNQFDPMRTFDEPLACYRNNVWAKRAYNLRYGNCDRAYGDHFREGFISGYCDVCEGGQGYIPAMPPQDYWETRYQCPEGAKCVNAWFEGFPAGVAAAKKDGSGEYHDVYISNMINAAVIQENSPAVLPGDIPVTSAEGYTPADNYAPSSNYSPSDNYAPANNYFPASSELIPANNVPPIVPDGMVDPSAGMPMPMSTSVQPAVYDMSGFSR